MGNPRTDWCFKTQAVPGLNGRAIDYPRGRTLGGCTSINGMIYIRGQALDYDGWRQLGNVGWAWDDVLPYFLKSEDQSRGGNELHGTGGELRVEDLRLSWEILDAFRDAAAEVGIPKTDDFNRGDNEGCGYFQVHQKRGVRWNNASAFLKPVRHRQNLTVLTEAQAKRIRFEGRRAVGIEFWLKGAPAYAGARAEVVLTSGAIGSPQLLQLSGVGPGALLREHGIPLVHELAGVGANLQDHFQIRLAYKVRNTKTMNERSQSLVSKALMGAEYLLFKRGPLTMSPSQLGAFAKSDPARETPNIEYHIQPLTTEKLGEALHPFPGFTASVCNLRPESRGHVRIESPDGKTQPAIQPNYFATAADQQVAVDSVKLTRRIAQTKALARFEPEEFKPGPGVRSDEDIVREAANIGTTIFHPVGTCKMGDDAAAVVDARLAVHGIDGLRVVDASIMPSITSGNTNAPVIMIAEKASDMILEDRG